VNGEHFRAFLWLRWRLGANQLRRGGTANAVVLIVLTVAAAFLAIGLFVGLFLVGFFALADASPAVVLFVWDGVVVPFLFFWAIGLVADLQRSEALSLTKFLHLPVSLSGAFLINYLSSSLLNPVLILFGPALVGLALGLVCARGPAWLFLFPLLAAFLLAVTALTYQFQGWLATLMANPRRRRTIIVVVTMVFVLLCQLPNLLINAARPRKGEPGNAATARLAEKQAELQRELAKGAITPEQFQKRQAQLQNEHTVRSAEVNRQVLRQLGESAWWVNLAVPPGWLPLGAAAVAEGNVLPALLGTLGLGLIGAGSLWRAYRTTVRFYTGQYTAGKRKPAAPALSKPAAARPAFLLERKLPGLSEQASAIALASFRSLTRAAEAKMMLLTPVLLVVIFGGMFLSQPLTIPEPLRPLLAFGAMGMILLGMMQFVGNQFGFDRHGFRVFVLCGASRRDILLGKNLAVAPLALALGTILAAILQIITPMRPDHFLAFFPQAAAMYLLYALLANALSILAPLPIASGSFKPSNMKGIPLLLNFVFLLVLPMVMGPLLLPLGIEYALHSRGWAEGVPVALLLSLAECAAAAGVYLVVLGWEGRWLQAREKKILQVVASKAE
jgi:hypothetical protein